jgi:hypothetical protein
MNNFDDLSLPAHVPNHIENLTVTLNPDGSSSYNIVTVPQNHVGAYFENEIEKYTRKKNTDLIMQREQHAHEVAIMNFAAQQQISYYQWQLQMQALESQRERRYLQGEMIKLLEEFASFKESLSLPSPPPLSLPDNTVHENDVIDADYEVLSPEILGENEGLYENIDENTVEEWEYIENVIQNTRAKPGEMIKLKRRRKGMADGSSRIVYVDMFENDIIYNEKTKRYDNVPLGCIVAYESCPVIKICPEDGKDTLSQEECTECLRPKDIPGWIKVDYGEKRLCAVDFYEKSPGDEDTEKEGAVHTKLYQQEQKSLSVYTHKIPGGLKNRDSRDNSVYWEAFDIPFNPNWKEITAKYIGGLTSSHVAIVRLLSKTPDGYYNDYISLYLRDNSYSRFFDEQYALMEDGKIPYGPVQIRYDADLINNPSYTCFISALIYARWLNNYKPFVIIEQIADYINGGVQRVLLSKTEPKTEIREEFNIFQGNHPESVFTNASVATFMCMYETSEDGSKTFVITKRGKSKTKKVS